MSSDQEQQLPFSLLIKVHFSISSATARLLPEGEKRGRQIPASNGL
jgi:hypothetical protein